MTPFHRYAPAMGVFFVAVAIMPTIFGISIMRGGSPIQPSTYGVIVWAIPAWVWVVSQLSLSLCAALSAARNHARLLALFAFLCGLLMEFFAAAAVLGNATEILLPSMAIPTGALCFLCAGIGWDHGR
jgi:hypothetical protein